MLARILLAAALLVVILLLPIKGWIRAVLLLLPYLCAGYDILIKAVKGVIRLQPFDENFLMAVATVGAIALGEYTEGVAVMLFYQIGELFQSCAVGKSRRSIAALMDIRPDTANLETDGGEIRVCDPDEISVGSILVVRPGERIPIDGVIVEGHSTVNTASLTGESLPRDVKEGDEIVSGCVNLTGLLRVRTLRVFGESTVSKILELVENASAKKSRSERFIARFARIYTPAVCLSAVALAILPPVLRMSVWQLSPMWGDWVYRALTFLVISCPCALVISIPLTFFAGIGGASREGILVKGSNYLEVLSRVDTVAMDKTGTVTRGVFEVCEIRAVSMEAERLLEYAVLAESYSTHPIAESLRRALKNPPQTACVSDVTEMSGRGVRALVDGVWVCAGNAELVRELGLAPQEPSHIGTAVHVTVDGVYGGVILLADQIKAGADEAIANLRAVGVRQTVMLTGDTQTVGDAVGGALGVDRVMGSLLPQEKLQAVEALMREDAGRGRIAFVGDGINDAPVLMRADVGIAMGALGADAAIEAADVVLMDDDPKKLARAIRISKKCMRIVYQNIVLALGIKFACLALGALGIANMWLAIFADVGVMVLAVLNAIRALRTR